MATVEKVHWRSKIKVTLDWSKSSIPTSSPLNNLGTNTYDLKSVQSVDPQVNTNIDVNDSIETERNGFLIKPGRVVLVMNVLAAAPLTAAGQPRYSDSAILSMLQYARAIMDITFSSAEGNDDFGQIVTLEDCMVNGGNPMQLTTDGRPLGSFNLHVLNITSELTGSKAPADGAVGGSTYSLTAV